MWTVCRASVSGFLKGRAGIVTAHGPEEELLKNFTNFGTYDTERCTVNKVKKYEYEKGLFVPLLAGIAKLIDHNEKASRLSSTPEPKRT